MTMINIIIGMLLRLLYAVLVCIMCGVGILRVFADDVYGWICGMRKVKSSLCARTQHIQTNIYSIYIVRPRTRLRAQNRLMVAAAAIVFKVVDDGAMVVVAMVIAALVMAI